MTWELAFAISAPVSALALYWFTSTVRSRIALRKQKGYAVSEATRWLRAKEPRHH